MNAHAVFAPSASDRWMSCPASHLRAAALPPAPSSAYAERGTLLHELGAIGIVESLKAVDARCGLDGIELEADERAAVATYVKFCKHLRKGADLWGIEKRVLHNDELFGTIDFYALKGDTLHVVDFKGGRGIRVDVIDNSQLLIYAMMLCRWVEQVALLQPPKTIQLHIVQPLFEGDAPIRGASYSREQIEQHRTLVQQAMDRAKRPDAPFQPGDHCRFCPVKPQCPALLGLAGQLPAPDKQDGLPIAKLSEWLMKADTIELWIAALREHAHGLINMGTAIPGWKLQDKRATRKWSSDNAVLLAAKNKGIVVREYKLLSPAQVEKKFRTIPLVLQPYVTQESSGKNLVRDPATAGAADSAQPQPALETALQNLQYRV